MSNGNDIKKGNNLKFKSTKELMGEYKQRQKQEKISKRQEQLMQKQQSLEKKKSQLYERRRQQLETKKQKVEIRKLQQETSKSGRLYAGAKQFYGEAKKTQSFLKAREKKRQVPSRGRVQAKGDNYIIINGTLYQRKGTVNVPKQRVKKKSEGFL